MRYRTLLFISSILVLVNAFTAASQKLVSDPVNHKKLFFIENKGQIIDQYNRLNPQVKFLLCLPGLKVQLKKNSFSYELVKTINIHEKSSDKDSLLKRNFGNNKKTTSQIERVDIEFLGANPNPVITPSLPSDAYLNYYTTGTPDEGITFVKQYQKVVYKNLYPNIDLEFVSCGKTDNRNGIKFNFIIRPGGDISQIKWKYNGTNDPSLEQGKIHLKTNVSELEETIPLSWSGNTRQKLSIGYHMGNDFVCSFSNYPGVQTNDTIWIDPVPTLLWCTYFGGSGTEYCSKSAVDSLGNIYVAGSTTSSTNIATIGAYQTIYGGGTEDGFIFKMNTDGTLQWATYFGGTDRDAVSDVDFHKSGNIIIAGTTKSTNNIASPSAYQSSLIGTDDAFVAMFSNSGQRLYSSYFGGNLSDVGYRIVSDYNGDIYLAGWTWSTSGIATFGSSQINLAGSADAFLVKFNSGFSPVWSTYFGGTDFEDLRDIVIDKNNNVYIAGSTFSTNGIATSLAFQWVNKGVCDGYFAKFSPSGSLVWGSYFGGTKIEYIYGIDVDNNCNVYITGETQSTNYISSPTAFQKTSGGYMDAFIAKFTTNCQRLWSTYYGGINTEISEGICFDKIGNLYINGFTASANISTSTAFQPALKGNGDAFILKMTPSGNRLWCTYFGGTKQDHGYCLKTDKNYTLYLTGETSSTDSMATLNAHQTVYGGGSFDCFVAKFSDCNAEFIANTLDTCVNKMIAFTDKSISYAHVNSILWNFGDGSTSFSHDTTHLYTIPGNYNVSLTITTSDSCVSTVTQPVTIFQNAVADFGINDSTQCFSGNKFDLTNNSVDTTHKVSYLWNFGDGTTDTASSLAYTYSTTGGYLIKLIAASSPKCADTMTKAVEIYPQSVLSFSINDSIQCLKGNSFNFINPSSGASNFLWDFGDGNSDTARNPVHSYSKAGQYIVVLHSTTIQGCSDSISKIIKVFGQPDILFSINDSNQCINGNTFIISNTTTGSNKYQWDMGDGFKDTTTNITHTYTSTGNYTIKLVVKTINNCIDSFQKVIMVLSEPKADYDINDSSQCLSANSFLFTNKSTIAKQFLWDFGDGITDTATNNAHIYAASGNYQVKLIVKTTGNCTDSLQKNIRVLPQPTAKYAVNDTTQCLSGNNFKFISISTGANNYFWDFGDGSNDTGLNTVHSYTTAGIYNSSLLVKSAVACSDSVKLTVTILDEPIAAFSVNDTSQLLPANNFVFSNLTNCKPVFSKCKFLWDFGDGNTDTTSNPAHSFASVGSYNVKLTVTGSNGCIDTHGLKAFVTMIIINAAFSVKDVCLGDSVSFNNNSTIRFDSFQNFLWDFGDGNTIVRPNPKHLYADTGTYYVQLITISYGGFKDTANGFVNVLPKPHANITVDPDTVLQEGMIATLTSNGSFDSLIWSTGSILAGITVSKQGIYTLRVVASNGCDDIDTVFIRYIELIPFSAMDVITPNGDGVNDYWKVFNIDSYKPSKVYIYNRWGDELYRSDNYNNDWNGTFKGKILPEGTYYFVLIAKNGKEFKGAVNVLK
jgi:gliding motility-associated-like protein